MTAITTRTGVGAGRSAGRPATRSTARATSRQNRPVGELLREWRERRRLSQLELSIQADVSTRHLSFVETGRSRPTPEMILRLTEQLEVPLRERNALLLAGGYAPAYPEHAFDQPELDSVRGALRQVLAGHEPFPAVVVNRWWELLEANTAIALFTASVAPELLEPPANVLRLALHPDGLAQRIVNLPEWRAHLLTQLRRRARSMGDTRLRELYDELLGYPGGLAETPGATDVVLPMRYQHGDQVLSLFSITAVVGTATDVTVDELAIESFYPADSATATALRELAAGSVS
ncbi:MAG TPA: helix-turn-helix transcriptional regulator [Jatrophihabitantaceae bacterium]|nr:helix-turn-helix transcriptional regulator [Jatrophihabitantaceae bacterium]